MALLAACSGPPDQDSTVGEGEPSVDAATADDPTSVDEYDAFGVRMMLPTDPTRFSWRLGDPNDDPAFRIDGNGDDAVLQADGSYLFRPREGGLASGGTQLTLRLHVSGTTATESFTDHAQLRQRGHMTNDPTGELGDQEMTGYFRLTGIERASDTISKKIRGGRHSDGSAAKYSACIGLIVPYDGESDEMWEKELFHPSTPKSSVTKLVDYGDVIEQGKWIGDKITSVRRPDGSVLNTQYLDLDPFDAQGKPKNNWVKVFEYVDQGPNVVSWSGRVSTWRIDEAQRVYGKYMSVRSVKAP